MQIRNKLVYLWGLLGAVLIAYPIYTLYINQGFFYTKVYDVELILSELVVWTIIMLIGYKKGNTIWLTSILLSFCYVHSMLLPILCAGIYYVLTAIIGKSILKLIFKKQQNYFDAIFCGMIFFILLYSLTSVFRIGSIENLRKYCIFISIITLFFFIYRICKGKIKIEKDNIFSTIYVSKKCYMMLIFIILFFMIQIGRAPQSLDYDSCWYGTRSGFVLDNVSGIYDDLKLVGCVYLYPKGAEIFSLPFSNLKSYTFVTAINIFAAVCIIGMIYRICRLFVDSKKALFGALIGAAIPGIMNMSVTAKPDLLTLFIQLIMIYHFLEFFIYRQGKEWIYIIAAYIFSFNFKPTAVLFSTTILIAGIFVCVVFKIKKKSKLEGYLLLISSIVSLGFVWGRTYILSGIPSGNLLASLFRKLGFIEKYPYNMSPFSPIASDRTLAERILLVCEFLFSPKTESGDHLIIAWGTTLCTFLAIVGIVAGVCSLKNIFREKKAKHLFVLCLLIGEFFGAILMVFVFRKPDGNYFQLYYVVTVISLLVFINWVEENKIRKYMIKGLIFLFIFLNMAISSSTNWVWCSSFSKLSFINKGYVNHVEEYKQMAKDAGFENIYSLLASDFSNKVYAIATHPDIERIPCVIESSTDVGYWGNPKLLETTESFLEFVKYEEYDYILIDTSYCSISDIDYIKALIDENMVSEIYNENNYVLLTMGKGNKTSNNVIKKILDECLEFRYIDGELYDDGWLGKKCSFQVNLQYDKKIKLIVNNVNNIVGQKLVCTYMENSIEYDISEGENIFEVELPAGNYCINFEMNKTFMPDNGDERALSVLFAITY